MLLRTAIIDGQIFQYRSGTDEQYVLKEVLIDWCYDFDFKSDDVILNLGGHIGAFDLFACPKVNVVVTLEPLKENYDKILKHLELNSIPNSMPINKAVAKYSGREQFGIGITNGHNGLVENMPESESIIEVETIAFEELLRNYPFTKIKCDIEGGEYAIFEDIELPLAIKEMWLETHTFDDKQKQQHLELMDNFRGQGFKVDIIENDHLDRTYLVHCRR